MSACIWLIPKQYPELLFACGFVSFCLSWMFNGKRENKVLENFFLVLPEAPCFHHFSRFCFSSHSSLSQFLSMNPVLIQCSYSHECCMHNTAKGSNASEVIFFCRSALYLLLLILYLFFLSKSSLHQSLHLLQGKVHFKHFKILGDQYRNWLVSRCVCVCTYALCEHVYLCMSVGG